MYREKYVWFMKLKNGTFWNGITNQVSPLQTHITSVQWISKVFSGNCRRILQFHGIKNLNQGLKICWKSLGLVELYWHHQICKDDGCLYFYWFTTVSRAIILCVSIFPDIYHFKPSSLKLGFSYIGRKEGKGRNPNEKSAWWKIVSINSFWSIW